VAALTHAELDALACFNSDIPPARALRPALERGTPATLRSLTRTSVPGTVVRATADLPPGALRCLVTSDRVRLITAGGPGANVARGLAALEDQGIRALAVPEGAQITFVVGSREVNLARLTLGDALGPSATCHTHDDTGSAPVLALGPDICRQPAAAEQVRATLAAAGVSAERVTPALIGADSACGLLALVPADARAAALAALHPLCATVS
jgi:aspartokinase